MPALPLFLSVIIPVYNVEAYLGRCLDSILAAGLPDAELILVDDGSTDGSGAVCDVYAERFPCVSVIHQSNRGLSSARNAGLAAATGEYVTFADSDDHVISAELARTVAALRESAERPDLLVTEITQVDADGRVQWKSSAVAPSEGLQSGPEAERRFFEARGTYWNVWRNFYRRGFLCENGLRFVDGLAFAEDMELNVRCFVAARRIAFLHAYFYCYLLRRPGSIMSCLSLSRLDTLVAVMEGSARLLSQSPGFTQRRAVMGKLAMELIYNLTYIPQLPRGDRAAAAKRFKAGLWILDEAGGVYSAARLALSIFGCRICGYALLAARFIRRGLRRLIRDPKGFAERAARLLRTGK